MTSIRLFIGWWSEGGKTLAQRLEDSLRHIIIETEPGDDGNLGLFLTIGAYPNAGCPESYDVLGAPITPADNAVNDKLAPVSQIHQHIFDVSHCNQPLQNSPTFSFEQFRGQYDKRAAA